MDGIGIHILLGVVGTLQAVTVYFIEYFEEISEESLITIKLLEKQLSEFIKKVNLVYDGVPAESISLPKFCGNQLNKLFEKLVQESRQSITPEKMEKYEQSLREDVAYQEALAMGRKRCEKNGESFEEIFCKGNIFHRQQISVVLYQEIITELRQYCENRLISVIHDILPTVNLDEETQEMFEEITSHLQAMKERKVFL